jgi:enamine deaminase RidA (YjgF/YER057c/UK114 family)
MNNASPDSQIEALGLVLPHVPLPTHVYKPVVITGNLLYISGHGPLQANGEYITGVVGRDLDLEAGRAAARQTGLALLSTLRRELGSLNRIRRVIKSLGMVNSAPDFYDHPKVINAFSELFAEIWGQDLGIGARSAVGMGPLPGNIAVEIEVIFELH